MNPSPLTCFDSVPAQNISEILLKQISSKLTLSAVKPVAQ